MTTRVLLAALLSSGLLSACMREASPGHSGPAPGACACQSDAECGEAARCDGCQCLPCPQCGDGQTCLRGHCLPTSCGAEWPCRPGSACLRGRCVDAACFAVTCAANEGCAQGRCFPLTCGGQPCALGAVCWEGSCTTADCVGVQCPADEACVAGRCRQRDCDGVRCADGAACDSGRCVPLACIGVTCDAGRVCALGGCVPSACGATSCLEGEGCTSGTCFEVGCLGLECGAGLACEKGACVAATGCRPTAPPAPCGVTGSGCSRSCTAEGTWGACQPASGPVDTASDPAHCGACGNACPEPLNAPAVCRSGRCGRGACEPGSFDLDGAVTFGCEALCSGTVCTTGAGPPLILDDAPLPERGLRGSLSAGSSLGTGVQTSPHFTNQGILGEPVSAGASASSSPSHRHLGGFTPALAH